MRYRLPFLTLALVALCLLVGGAYASPGATTRVSVDSSGNQANGDCGAPDISADGRYVAFWSKASNLVPGDTNHAIDIFVHDRQTGATERVSVDSSGNQGDGHSCYLSSAPTAATWPSTHTRPTWCLATPTTCGTSFVHDRQTGATERVSVDSAGNQGERPQLRSCHQR